MTSYLRLIMLSGAFIATLLGGCIGGVQPDPPGGSDASPPPSDGGGAPDGGTPGVDATVDGGDAAVDGGDGGEVDGGDGGEVDGGDDDGGLDDAASGGDAS